MSLLLSPVNLAKLSLNNRVVMPPMCMYEVHEKDGEITPFHMAHYGARAAEIKSIFQGRRGI